MAKWSTLFGSPSDPAVGATADPDPDPPKWATLFGRGPLPRAAPMAADVTAVAPGAIDPSRKNEGTAAALLREYRDRTGGRMERLAEQAETAAGGRKGVLEAPLERAGEFVRERVVEPVLAARPEAAKEQDRRAAELAGMTGGEMVGKVLDVTGVTDPMLGPAGLIAGDAPAGLAAAAGAFGRGRIGRVAEILDDLSDFERYGSPRPISAEAAAADPYLYHVTSRPNAEKILQEGFQAGRDPLMGRGGGYEAHSRGRVFFTDKKGVNFWRSRTEEHLFDQFDDPPDVVVLRIRRDALPGLQADELGTRDARANSFFVGMGEELDAGRRRAERAGDAGEAVERAGGPPSAPADLDAIAEPHRSSIRELLDEWPAAEPGRQARIDKSIKGLAWEGRKRAAKLRGDAETAEAAKDPVVEAVVREYGTTSDPREAGYILPDGRMLDLSGKRQGGPSGNRALDHREVGVAYPDDAPRPPYAEEGSNAGYMLDFMNRGNIRVSAHSGGSINVDLMREPTPEQARRISQMVARERGLAEVAIDVSREDGEVIASAFLEGARPSEVAEAIRRLFREARAKGGEGPLRMGFASTRLLEPVAGAGVGAAAGAVADDESPVRGAVVGGAAGAVAGAGARPLARRLRSPESRALGGVATDVGEDAAQQAEKFTRAATADLDAIDPDEYVNISKFALDPTGEARLRDEVKKVVAEHGLAPKERVPWSETRRQAAQVARSMGLSADDLSAKVGRLSGADMLAIRNVVRSNTEQAGALSKRLATDATMTADERSTAERVLSAIEAQNDALLGRFVKERSQTGRDLNNLKILARSSMDPMVWFTKAKRTLGDNPFTDEMRDTITRLINEGNADELARYVASLRKATIGEKATTLWKAGLLTSPTTHGANILGNTTMALLETAKDAPAVLFDRLISTALGTPRTKTFRGLTAAKASLRGANKGIDEAVKVMQGAPLDNALRKYDYFREVNFNNAILDTYTKTIFRSLGAEDRIFRGAALERSLAEQAHTRALNEGLKGAEAKARALELARNPSDEMTLQAIADAELATFTNRGALGGVISGAKRAARTKSDALATTLDVIAPFTNTPANVATRVLEYSPLGALSTVPDVVRLLRRSLPASEMSKVQRKVVERLGRSSVGTAPVLAGYMLAQNGKMTAGYPDDSRTRGAWGLEGKQENSLLVNGKWRSLERVSPLGNLMVFGAHLHKLAENPELSPAGKAMGAVASMGKTIKEQSFLRGVSEALAALDDPEYEAQRLGESLAGSVIPSVVGRAARVGDPVVRETEGAAERVTSRVPGLRKGLPAKMDQFGEPIQTDPSALANIFDPFTSRADRTQSDPLIAEMARVGAGITQMRQPPDTDRETWRLYQEIYGQALREDLQEVILSHEYGQALSEQEQRELIEAAASRSRSRVTRELKAQGLR